MQTTPLHIDDSEHCAYIRLEYSETPFGNPGKNLAHISPKIVNGATRLTYLSSLEMTLKNIQVSSVLRRKVPKKVRRLKGCFEKNMFDLYSNLFTEEEETNYFASDGNKHASPPPSYHSKYITTILPGGIHVTPDVVVFGGI